MNGTIGSAENGHFCWRSAHVHDSGEGPDSLPFPRHFRLNGDEVDLSASHIHATAVSELLRRLDESAAVTATPAPDPSWLRLAHPSNTREHAAQLCRLACVDMSAAKPGEELAAILTCGAHFVQDRWAAACTKLNAIPRQLPRNLHSSGASYPSMPTRRMDAPSRCSAAPSETVVQIALHTPDNNFSRSHLILASASHTLSQVKDAIRCVNVHHAEDVLGSVLTGGYMFIESTLYVDDRDPGACKYHEPILKFLKEQATQVGQAVWKYLHANGLAIAQPEDSAVPPVRSMSTTRLCDLKMLPGQLSQYVFAHAGACEHMMLIEDIRLNHATDPSLEQGPVVTRAVPETLLKCCICMLRPGVKLACDDKLAPTSPAVFCEKCFHELHYASDGHPVTDQIGMDVFGVHVR